MKPNAAFTDQTATLMLNIAMRLYFFLTNRTVLTAKLRHTGCVVWNWLKQLNIKISEQKSVSQCAIQNECWIAKFDKVITVNYVKLLQKYIHWSNVKKRLRQ